MNTSTLAISRRELLALIFHPFFSDVVQLGTTIDNIASQAKVDYIASQAPLNDTEVTVAHKSACLADKSLPIGAKHTTREFWDMIWEQKTPIIVMLTDFYEGQETVIHKGKSFTGTIKAEKYWPEDGEQAMYGEQAEDGKQQVMVKSGVSVKDGDTTLLVLTLTKDGESHTVTHLHVGSFAPRRRAAVLARAPFHRLTSLFSQYTGWKDFGRPEMASFEAFWQRYRTFREAHVREQQETNAQVVVHCR